MAIITPSEVFDFMGLGEDQRELNENFIYSLINSEQDFLENRLNRKLEKYSKTNLDLFDGDNCRFFEDFFYMYGNYGDILSISELKRDDTVFVLGEDFSLSDSKAVIFLKSFYLLPSSRFKMSFEYGFCNSDGTPKPSCKNILKEMVSVKSKLYKQSVNFQGVVQDYIVTDLLDSSKEWIKRNMRRDV